MLGDLPPFMHIMNRFTTFPQGELGCKLGDSFLRDKQMIFLGFEKEGIAHLDSGFLPDVLGDGYLMF